MHKRRLSDQLLLLDVFLALDQKDPLLFRVVLHPVTVVVTKPVKGIVAGKVFIGEVPELEAPVNQPVLAHVGLPVRIELCQNVPVMP